MSIEQVFYAVLLFVIFYIGVLQKDRVAQYFFSIIFLIISFIMRLLVDIEINKDFYGYYTFYRIEEPQNWWEYFTNEPYLYLLHLFFSKLFYSKIDVFYAIYYFNYIVVTLFFLWLMCLRGISAWKKVIFFTLYYFLFSYTLLRNGIPYIIYTYFIYLAYRNLKTKWVYITPFMHISSLIPMILVFHKHKKYRYYLVIFGVSLALMLFIGNVILNRPEFALISYKIEAYQEMNNKVSIFHYFYSVAITFFCYITWLFVKNKFWNPIILTAMFLYYCGFFINPVVGFRFSPYLIMSILFMDLNTEKYTKLNQLMNIGVLFLCIYFVFTLYDTHYFNN